MHPAESSWQSERPKAVAAFAFDSVHDPMRQALLYTKNDQRNMYTSCSPAWLLCGLDDASGLLQSVGVSSPCIGCVTPGKGSMINQPAKHTRQSRHTLRQSNIGFQGTIPVFVAQ
jgi:hypothetical protein